MSEGRVYLVGAGPGDPALITVRGRELLAAADVVIYDYLAAPRLLQWVRPDAERIYVGKQAGAHTLSQDEINELLVDRGRGGRSVVRLKGGDPFVFGRGGEEALALADAGIDFEVVPGVTAGVAAAAYAGIPVTHRKLASNLGLVTGHETPDKEDSDLDFAALAQWKGTLAFYMGVKNLGRICQSLVDHGLDSQTPCAVIRWGTTTQQQVVVGTVSDAAERVRAAQLKPPALIVIGQVVALRDKLNWFESRPLFGRRVVVTRSRQRASALSEKLRALGADVVEMPTIRIEPPEDPEPLRQAVADLASFDWVVFTSANAVDGFFGALGQAGLDSRALAGVRLCTVGPATAERLAMFGLRSDAQPEKFTASQVVPAMASVRYLAGATVLCPRSDIAPRELIDALIAQKADVREVVAYRTAADCSGADQVADLLSDGRIQWITFTSSSTVKNFLDAIEPEVLRSSAVSLASIGPATSATLRESGFEPTIQAESHTIDGLVAAILKVEALKSKADA